jgi:hypothetical protein
MRAQRLLAVLAAVAAMLAAAPAARGDGMYFPEHAFPELPTIPMQRALIVHKGGMETLVVESTFKSGSPGVGWVLPLPAEPTAFSERATSGDAKPGP